MSVKEIYDEIAGDYQGVLERMSGKEALVEKFALKFLNDASYNNLEAALNEKDYDAAFRASHTLKGVASNLGFTELYKWSSEVTEKLRSGDNNVEKENKELSAAYDKVTTALKKL